MDQFAIKCKLERNGWIAPCKIKSYLPTYDCGGIVFGKNYNFVTEFKFKRTTNTDIADEYINYHEHCSSDESDSESEFTLLNSDSSDEHGNENNKYSRNDDFDKYSWK